MYVTCVLNVQVSVGYVCVSVFGYVGELKKPTTINSVLYSLLKTSLLPFLQKHPFWLKSKYERH